MKYVISPVWIHSGPEHWQSWLEHTYENCVRVEQKDLNHVDRQTWIAGVYDTVESLGEPWVRIGHSCGFIAIAQFLAQAAEDKTHGHHILRTVRGALLVAPADVEAEAAPRAIKSQAPIPVHNLPVPTILVVSNNDPYATQERSILVAQQWGSELYWVDHAGHIAGNDGYGPWGGIVPLIEKLAGETL